MRPWSLLFCIAVFSLLALAAPLAAASDLTVLYVGFTETRPLIGDTIGVYVATKNIGTTVAGASHTLSYDGRGIPYLFTVPSLPTGTTHHDYYNFTCPARGNFVFNATADAWNEVNESNEGNNFGWEGIYCRVANYTNRTFNGDGQYYLLVDDAVISSANYRAVVTSIVASRQQAEYTIYSPSGQFVGSGFLGEGETRTWYALGQSYGIRITAVTIFPGAFAQEAYSNTIIKTVAVALPTGGGSPILTMLSIKPFDIVPNEPPNRGGDGGTALVVLAQSSKADAYRAVDEAQAEGVAEAVSLRQQLNNAGADPLEQLTVAGRVKAAANRLKADAVNNKYFMLAAALVVGVTMAWFFLKRNRSRPVEHHAKAR
ncbi:MAG: CARDB domain-containing protein, partial [Candidatus Micrarchaeota archaeon]